MEANGAASMPGIAQEALEGLGFGCWGVRVNPFGLCESSVNSHSVAKTMPPCFHAHAPVCITPRILNKTDSRSWCRAACFSTRGSRPTLSNGLVCYGAWGLVPLRIRKYACSISKCQSLLSKSCQPVVCTMTGCADCRHGSAHENTLSTHGPPRHKLASTCQW